MTNPHQCRCAICGAIGTIVPGLPNVFAQPPTIQPVEPDQSASAQSFKEAVDALTADPPRTIMGNVPEVPAPLVATCTHGYTICRPCKFPPDVAQI